MRSYFEGVNYAQENHTLFIRACCFIEEANIEGVSTNTDGKSNLVVPVGVVSNDCNAVVTNTNTRINAVQEIDESIDSSFFGVMVGLTISRKTCLYIIFVLPRKHKADLELQWMKPII